MKSKTNIRNIFLSLGIFVTAALSIPLQSLGVEEHITTLFVFAIFLISLLTEGFQVIGADSCEMEKTMFTSYLPDVVILDLGLSGRRQHQKTAGQYGKYPKKIRGKPR